MDMKYDIESTLYFDLFLSKMNLLKKITLCFFIIPKKLVKTPTKTNSLARFVLLGGKSK